MKNYYIKEVVSHKGEEEILVEDPSLLEEEELTVLTEEPKPKPVKKVKAEFIFQEG